MIDQTENLIFINGENRTPQIKTIKYGNHSFLVVFNSNNTVYNYSMKNVEWLRDPKQVDLETNIVKINGYSQKNVKSVSVFSRSILKKYYYIVFGNNFGKLYEGKDVKIVKSVLKEPKSKKVFEYLSEVASANQLKTNDGDNILSIQYQKIVEIDSDSVLAGYLNPKQFAFKTMKAGNIIFPFGCNSSQYKAVCNALENQLSVIQGPPGTGKTQTILNIMANILISGQSVMVVSNNNSATENVLEKLKKYGMDFLVAPLGSTANKQKFLEQFQAELPEDFKSWKSETTDANDEITRLFSEISDIYHKQEQLASLKQQFSDWKLEYDHFKQSYGNTDILQNIVNVKSDYIMELLNIQHNIIENKSVRLGKLKWFFFKLKFKYIYKLDLKLLEYPDDKIICQTQEYFYVNKLSELESEINNLEQFCKSGLIKSKTDRLTELSMSLLKNAIYNNFHAENYNKTSVEFMLKHEPANFIKTFPIVLSTTFSAVSSVRGATYNYLIMDEASQVTVETGALALSCAHNAVVVGDTMQLPNVVTQEDKEKLNAIFSNYAIENGYNSAEHSFLESILAILPELPQTLLREHYRCNPEIINFCNQKFYGGKLVLMTERTTDNAISAIKTVVGNHCRGHENQREIDIICNEILPNIKSKPEEIGIIAPYNSQVNAIKRLVDKNIEVATVHKYQGREKDVIIMSVTDDQIGEFADNANLLNVAVSRAKKQFLLVVTGNEQAHHGNISDLLDYIEYNGGQIVVSKISSVFDMLYKQYNEKRAEFLKGKKKVSQYDSENLMYHLITEILNCDFKDYDVLINYPINRLIIDNSLLNDDEKRYISHNTTHIDFLIFSRVSKKAILAIEVDGWMYHHEGTTQSHRDKLKDHVLELYKIPLLRLSTNGSNEKEIITKKLQETKQ